MPHTILHLDLDAFFCAVEENQAPSLRGKPFAVGGKPNERGVVSSCSYAARQYGVRSAMPMSQAIRTCPSLTVVPPRHHLYRDVSRRVMERLRRVTALVEQISIDEAFLDISDIAKTALGLLRKVRQAGRPVRLIGVGVSGLGAPARQLGLWDAGAEKQRRLQEVVDALKDKYGEQAIKKGK